MITRGSAFGRAAVSCGDPKAIWCRSRPSPCPLPGYRERVQRFVAAAAQDEQSEGGEDDDGGGGAGGVGEPVGELADAAGEGLGELVDGAVGERDSECDEGEMAPAGVTGPEGEEEERGEDGVGEDVGGLVADLGAGGREARRVGEGGEEEPVGGQEEREDFSEPVHGVRVIGEGAGAVKGARDLPQ